MIISINTVKVLYKIQQQKKQLNKKEIEKNYLNKINVICEKHTAKIMFSSERLKFFL